ncbi:MAG: superoxide dismutase family protein [Acidimicrobiaceae bacterium]|nr:superoxide dismutase family protein [Acidimicrobiaceae bacterium]MXW76629.1 superoxide dismutase family protein [Acidimicrobiaceae bacterium]MYC42789.1 superoxide dismutase family protein [Acidimicrobiaceae bacterium]MYD08281.1 superoxide dismutase family protein [Acidimicrobiaceae bacterium]MYH87711.1 superoxide dismutase family protein [Acidimicrobiaceae bacterium]
MNATRRLAAFALTVTLAVTACGADDADTGGYSADNLGTAANASIIGTDGAQMGTASFRQGPTGVLITVNVSGLAPGGHGIHLHAVGTCAPDFKASGGHINPSGEEGLHGLLGSGPTDDGQDHGDLPNIYAAADGEAVAEFFTTFVTVDGGSMPALLDDDGSALVIHENPDDHVTQPIGGAGGRVACGVIN